MELYNIMNYYDELIINECSIVMFKWYIMQYADML